MMLTAVWKCSVSARPEAAPGTRPCNRLAGASGGQRRRRVDPRSTGASLCCCDSRSRFRVLKASS